MTKPMTNERRAEIQAMLEAATPGPWQWCDSDSDTPLTDVESLEYHQHNGFGFYLSTIENYVREDSWVGPLPRFIVSAEQLDGQAVDALLIAACPTVIAELLAEVDYWREGCHQLGQSGSAFHI